jgi:protein involved in polysaccharide export with SLBB domain
LGAVLEAGCVGVSLSAEILVRAFNVIELYRLSLLGPSMSVRRCLNVCLKASVLSVVLAATSFAQVPTPTPEQLQLLNSLPPAQRQALMDQYRNFQRQQAQQGGTPEPQPGDIDPLTELLFEPELTDEEELELEEDPRLEPGDTIVIEFNLASIAAAGSAELQQRLIEGNPYVLDESGNLYLPGIPTIGFGGLNVDEAGVRLEADAALQDFDMFVTLLPLDPTGADGLERFGYALFEDRDEFSLQPATDVPVPAGYQLGPGDALNVQLFGNVNLEYYLIVSRDGSISFPEIGPISVAGLDFQEARNTISERVTEQLIGVRSSVTLGELRTIRVFVLGEVAEPGSYAVSGLSTMTNALFESGGVSEVGSLRHIQLNRNGETITTLDLYDLLLRGDTSNDARLQPGDVIFVPPIGDTFAVSGEVKRPGVYELMGGESLRSSIELAGGLTALADATNVRLERIVSGRGITVEELNLNSAESSASLSQNGDFLRVLPNLDQLEDVIVLEGNVQQPGRYQWISGMYLTDLISSSEMLKPMSDVGYVLVRRERSRNLFIDVLSVDLASALASPRGASDLMLQPRDTIHVFNLAIGRQHILEPLMEELRAQVPVVMPVVAVARIGGSVRAPGEYPLEPQMQVSDLIRAGGGLSESAYVIDAELTRYEVVNGEYRETELVTVDLAGILNGVPGADLVLSAHDYLNIREVPRWGQQQSVELRGEVVFPGVYPIRQGETLSSVLERAGGLTELAFPEGTIFLREELREREREQLETLAERIQGDLVALSLSDPSATQALSIGQSLIAQIEEAQPVGRMVVSLDRIAEGDVAQDVLLKAQDRILVPSVTQAVTVLGEVQYATSHLYEPGLTRDEYLQRSGGLTANADDERVYVVRANGQVEIESGSRWFRRSRNGEIRPGDSIVVPLDTDRVRPLVFWTSATSVIYNLAIAVAAINGL